MDKVLTISIAAYNASNTIRAALDSLVTSDVLDELEIIVVNDGSLDNTQEIVEEYVSKYPKSVSLINKENGGWGSTVNESSKIAKGKYYKLLDADDDLETESLKGFVEYLKECDSDIVLTDFEYVYPKKRELVNYHYEPKQNIDIRKLEKILMHGMAVKTETIKGKIDLLEKCFYTDGQFAAQCVNISESFSYLPIKVYNYNMGSSSQSVSLAGYVRHAKDHEKALNEILKIADNNEKFELIVKNHYQYLIGDQLYIYLLNKKYKHEFFSYYEKIKRIYPNALKKTKIYIKISCKSPLFYNICSFFLSKKIKR